MFTALARAGDIFAEPDWIAAAVSTYKFVLAEMAAGDRLFHSWCAGRAQHPAVIEDYANMASGALALHEDCAVCFCEILFQSATKRVVKEPGDESSALKMLESVSSAIVSCGGGGATFGNVGDDVGDFRGVGEVLRVFSD